MSSDDPDISGSDEEAGFVGHANFIGAIKIISDDGLSGGKRLRQRAREGFAIGKVRQTIHDADVFGNLRG